MGGGSAKFPLNLWEHGNCCSRQFGSSSNNLTSRISGSLVSGLMLQILDFVNHFGSKSHIISFHKPFGDGLT
jgi:hypothetical protein